MKTSVILVTLGGPRSLEEVPEFIKRFVGRELPPPALRAVIERYRLIGGFSPLCRITEEQAKALKDALGPEYLCAPAFRYAPPFITDVLESMAAAGPARIHFLLLSPFFTSVTTGNYIDVAKDYLAKHPLPLPVDFIHSWYREPLFIESWVEAIRGDSFDEETFYLFSAHSLPMRYAGEPYRQQIEETVAMVASRAGISNHALGWQSIPTNAAEPWIDPTVEEQIDGIAAAGFKRLVQVPIGFTADHIETLYDIDITHRQYALGKGLSFRRIASLNAGAPFIQALKEIVTKANQLEVVAPANPGSESGTGAGVQCISNGTRMNEISSITKKTAIIGGGISALACAVDLKEKGVEFTLFEKEQAVGGKLCTEKIGGFTVEGGPDSYLPEKYWSVQLIKKVGLAADMLCSNDEHKGTFIFSRGRLHPLPEGVMLMVPTMIMPLAKSRLLSWPGKIKMGMELFVPPRCDLKDESLAEFVTRRLGRECLEKIAEPLVAGIHTSNPDNMSVLATFPRFVEMERKSGSLIRGMVVAMKNRPPQNPAGPPMTYFMSLKEGMQELVQGCVRYIGAERIRTGTAVVSVTKNESGYRLTFGDGTTADFAAVVFATPSFVTKEIIGAMDPELTSRLSAIAWSSSATVSLAFRKADLGKDPPGFGFIIPRIENRRINACTWSSIKWVHRAPDDTLLIRSFVGGGHHEDLVSLGDSELVTIVLEELREIVGLAAKPVFSKVYRWFQGMPKYTVGHLERIAAIDELRKKHRGLYLIGSSYRGIGIGDCVKSGFDAAAAIMAL